MTDLSSIEVQRKKNPPRGGFQDSIVDLDIVRRRCRGKTASADIIPGDQSDQGEIQSKRYSHEHLGISFRVPDVLSIRPRLIYFQCIIIMLNMN